MIIVGGLIIAVIGVVFYLVQLIGYFIVIGLFALATKLSETIHKK